jgi:fucose permease
VSYRHTLIAVYGGAASQAVINNLAPLLFLTFQRQFDLSLASLAALISLNFGVQLLIDFASAWFVDKIGYRSSMLIAEACCVTGLVSLGLLPFALPHPFIGIAIAVVINALGGGLLEVLISPIVEALPGENKAAAMSLLHSFYCWGYMTVVLLSTLFFNLAGIENWPFLSFLWALLPLTVFVLFIFVPLRSLIPENEVRIPLGKLFSNKIFLILFMLMLSAGASEQAMSQWSSLFAEAGLGVSKTSGDLLGPCAFALMMGLGRVFFSRQKTAGDSLREKRRLERTLFMAFLLCMSAYLITAFAPWPLVSLAACALTGFSVSVMWPGVFSLASKVFPSGGTALFAILALAGDLGCAAGPALAGAVMNSRGIHIGLLSAIIFPALGLIALQRCLRI